MRSPRDWLCGVAVGGLCAVSTALLGAPRIDGLHVARVLGGPLRGRALAMPTLQRPSYALGTFEAHVVAAMRATVQPGSVAYDVGANVGYHTLVLRQLVGPSGTVLAVEPAPRERAVLGHNLRINGLSQVQMVATALAEQPGTLQFATFGYSGIGRIAREREPADATIVTVPATTLDALVFEEGRPPPAFLKIDVEGAELRVLLGGMRVLATVRPTIVCEVRWGATHEPISALMQAQGYEERLLRRTRSHADVLFTPAPDRDA